MKDIAIFGAGGFGREVLALVQDINAIDPQWNILGFFDDHCDKGQIINDYPILGTYRDLNQWESDIDIAIGIGNPVPRKEVFEKIHNPHVHFPTLLHPSVWIGNKKFVDIGRGSIICTGNLITTNVRIGDFVVLNLGCTVGHDSVINDFAAIMPYVNISGEVTVGKGVLVGSGATIINQLQIGNDTIVGAGAVVTASLPDNCTVVGVPAKPIKFNP